MKRILTLVVLLLALVLASSSLASTPLGGLAVAVSPSGDTLAAAGDSRVLYVLNAEKMEVLQRVWLGVCIVDLEFDKSGNLLLAEDTDGTLHLIDAKTWQVAKTLPKAEKMCPARNADMVAALNPDYNGHIAQMLSMTDLSEKGKVAFAKGQKVIVLGLDAAGGRLGVLSESVNDESEPKGAKPPADLKGLNLEEFKLKNDGKTSQFMLFKVPGGEKIAEHKLYYSASSSGWKMLFQGDDALVVNYSNLNARIDPKGQVTLFNLDNSFNYGIGVSADQKLILSGGLALGTYTKVDGLSMTKFQPDRLAGWPEYFKSFTVAGDGTAYGSTSGYRIVKIKPGGAFEKSVPVY